MGKKGKKALAGKPKKLTPKDVGKRLDTLVKKVEEELEDADLFASLPPTEDCAICLVPLSRLNHESYYQACCGNNICYACYKETGEAIKKQNEENDGKKLAVTCPFCREPVPPVGQDYVRLLEARCLQNDHNAFNLLGGLYRHDQREIPKDELKSLDYFIRAVELGSPVACTIIAMRYDEGDGGVAVNKERAALFDRVGALRGDILGRHNIGCQEYRAGSHETAIRHLKISAEAGDQTSLDALRAIYNGNRPGKEFISKDYLESIYRACHDAQMEVKSEEREKHSGAIEKLPHM